MNTIPSMKRLVLVALLFFSLSGHTAIGAPTPPEPSAASEKPRIVIGRVEFVVLQDVHLRLKARIDTGAGVSSVHAKILEIKQAPDGERVRFQVQDAEGRTKTLERAIVGWANIKVMGTDKKNRRPIVRLDICLGGKKLEGRVNLNDRSNYLYPMLIGRNLLNTGKFLVDPGALYLKEPGCE
jgi:hypothetical protein